jgi:hypothetical protein
MRKLLIALVVLVVLLVAADRIGVAVAENQISGRIATGYGLPAKPGVTIAGFPFLTQVVAGDYQEIDVSVTQVQADGTTLHNLTVRLTGVHASVSQVLGGGSSMVTADRAAGSAMVGFSAVGQRLPHGLRLTPAGKNLKVSGSLSYQGIRVPVSAMVALGVSAGGIGVTPVSGGISAAPLSAGLPGASSVRQATAKRLRFVVPLSTLPLHLQLTSVRVTPGGLRIGAAARNVQFARG